MAYRREDRSIIVNGNLERTRQRGVREEEKKGTGWNGVGAQGAEGNIKGKEKGGIDQWRDRGEEG